MKRPCGLTLDGVLEWFGVPSDDTDECVRPREDTRPCQRSDGYYDISFGGETRTLHSLIVQHALGHRLMGTAEVRHTCGNSWCINRCHLVPGTRLENHRDQYRHGTRVMGERHPAAKLSDLQVEKIRGMFGSSTDSEIASHFGVARQTINDIRNGRRRSGLGSAA